MLRDWGAATRRGSRQPLAVGIGLVVRRASLVFGFYLIGVALAEIGSARAVAVSTSAAVVTATCIATVLPAPDLRASVALDAILTLACVGLTLRAATPTLTRIVESPGAELQALTSPRSFLWPSNQVFVLMFIFSVAVGFGSVLRTDSLAPLTSNLSIVMLLGAVMLFLAVPSRREDALFTVTLLLVATGFLAAPIISLGTGVANALLYAGRLAFGILSWTALSSLCARNPVGSAMVLACGGLANDAGALTGTEFGTLCNALLAENPQAVAIVTGFVVLALLAYALTGLRSFSFAQTIHAVEPAKPMPTPSPVVETQKPLDEACDRLAARHGLTTREREVLGMLARGHNGYHIRDELSLSYNTVKTHAKHVYAKLGTHSQQEVIDAVEREASAGRDSGDDPHPVTRR